nr:SRPBCC family protein [Streptomyces sp. SID5468]
MRQLRSVGLDFVTDAPVLLAFAAGLRADADAVYRALTEDTEGWSAWFRAVASALPTGEGRRIRLTGGVRFAETFLAMDEAERFAYRVDATNLPGVRALLEDWRLAPMPTGGTRLRWIFAADAAPAAAALLRVARPAFDRAFADAVRALDRRLAPAPVA